MYLERVSADFDIMASIIGSIGAVVFMCLLVWLIFKITDHIV